MNKQYQAARRALAIVNRLPAGTYRAYHVSRIFAAMNKLRAGVAL